MNKLNILEDEIVEKSIKPHPIAFMDLYLVWLYLFGIGFMILLCRDMWGGAFASLEIVKWFRDYISEAKLAMVINNLIGFFTLFIPALFFAFSKINIHWIFLTLLYGAGMIVLSVFTDITPFVIYLIPMVLGFVGLSQVEFYRRAHHFYITNYRLIFIRTYKLMTRYTVESYYQHISNLVLKKTLFENLFGCGTIIPIMTSGMNLGSEIIELKAGILFMGFGAKREKKLPRAIPYLCFYSVFRPEEIMSLLTPKVAEKR
jgi:hypothetical protein